MRAVLDTVVFVRALINPKGRWGRLLFDLSGGYIIVLSPAILREVLEVIYRSSLLEKFTAGGRTPPFEEVLGLLQNADVVEPNERLAVCRDPEDDKFFECAVSGAADYVVSEDRDILDVREFQGVRTVTAEEFIQVLSAA